MPTESHLDILYRDLARVQVSDVFPDASPLLIEIVNFATNALVRCMSYADGEENLHLAAFSLYRHILEATDAIQVLVENACSPASKPLLRTSFEALLSLEYITESSNLYRQRSLSWLASYARQQLRAYEALDPSFEAGEEFLKAIEKDKTVREFPPMPAEKVAAGISNMEQLLSRDQFKGILAEYEKHKREPKWFHLFGGPSDLRRLAQHLKRNLQYDVLYRQWSMSAHAQDFYPFIAPSPPGEPRVRGLRDAENTNEVVTFSTTFLIDATRLVIEKFHPGEMWGNWYMREVRERYLSAARSFRR